MATALTHIVCWTPDTDEIALVEWPDEQRLSARFACTALACDMMVHGMSRDKRIIYTLLVALRCIVAYNIPPDIVCQTFDKLEEFSSAFNDLPLRRKA